MVDGYGLTLGDTRTPSTSPTYFVLCKPPMDKHDHDEYIPFVSGLSYFCTNPARNLSYAILSKSITCGKKGYLKSPLLGRFYTSRSRSNLGYKLYCPEGMYVSTPNTGPNIHVSLIATKNRVCGSLANSTIYTQRRWKGNSSVSRAAHASLIRTSTNAYMRPQPLSAYNDSQAGAVRHGYQAHVVHRSGSLESCW